MAVNKVLKTFDEAVADVFDGATILCGGAGLVGGAPCYLFRALAKHKVKDLTLVGNAPVMGWGAAKAIARTVKIPEWFDDASLLVENRQVKKLIISVPGLAITGMAAMEQPFPVMKALSEGQKIEIEMTPQGTLAERIRAARAGIPAFYTPTGVGTLVQKGKEVRVFNGREYLLEHAIEADFALIWAYKADRFGNLVYRGTSRTFNPTMAGAATVTIAEVEHLVELGELDPEVIVTPAVYVDRIVVRPKSEV